MINWSEELAIDTNGFCDFHDLTDSVTTLVAGCGLMDGLATVFTPGSTASVTTVEFETGALNDLRRAIEKIAPQGDIYEHNRKWGDGNGFSHVRSALMGPQVTVPVKDGKLRLGTWQQILLIDFDNRPRTRTVIVQMLGS